MDDKLFGKIPYKYLIIGMWSVCLLGLIVFLSSFIYVAKTRMPDTQELENPKFEESSIVYSEDLVEIDRYYRKNRQWVRYEDLSPHLTNALIATEDHRYLNHSGIDAYGLGRAVAHLGTAGGASTIPQQLAKLFYTPSRSRNPIKRIWQKMPEWVIAIEFERRYTKQEILAMFLNKFDFLNQGIGVASAANVYFGKDQKDLTITEAAMLVGMLKNPNYYNPVNNPERATRRRNTVLGQMLRNGYLTKAEATELRQEPLDMSAFNKGETYAGLAPYFMAELKKHIRSILIDENITKPGGVKFDLDSDGLEIYSTIDTRYQRHAEAAMTSHMAKQQETFFNSWKNSDPWTYLEKDVTNGDRQLAIRDAQITAQVELTDIYKILRYKHLNSIIDEITTIVPDARLWEGDISRLLKAEKDKGYLASLVKTDYISQDQKTVYEQILKLPEYKVLKSKYNDLKSEVKIEVNRKRPMKLYGYNGIVEKTMTPIDSIKYMNMFLQLGSVSIEPKTGYVRSWVGGTDYNIWKYDHVTSNRQVGSTFKPFLYTAAISKAAIQPCRKVRDEQYVISKGEFGLMESWIPGNSHEFSNQEVTLKEALKLSLNSISIWLIKEIGSVEPVIDIARAMGIKSEIPHAPSIVLGSPEINVLELTSAYATFANGGIRTNPIFIKKIKYKGVVIYESQIEQERAISEEVNYAMVELLKHAASSRAYALKTDFGGKTGTTNDHVDGWFVGITPNLVTGTWVGGDQQWIRYRTLSLGQGGQMARPYFIDYMQRVEADEEIDFETNAKFLYPANMGIVVDCDQYEDLYTRDSTSTKLVDEFDEELE